MKTSIPVAFPVVIEGSTSPVVQRGDSREDMGSCSRYVEYTRELSH
jgi:hypothetical protein